MSETALQEGAPESSAPRTGRDPLGIAFLVHRLCAYKWLLLGITLAAAAFSVYYTLGLSNIFRAEVKLAPAAEPGTGGAGLGTGNLRGLANLVGIDMGKRAGNKQVLALEVLHSRQFITSFVEKRQIAIPLIAGKRFDPATGKLLLDTTKYDPATGKWHIVNRNGVVGAPSAWAIYNAFQNVLDVKTDELTGITTLAIEFFSPVLAKEWANWLVTDLNDQMRMRDAYEARASIRFLEKQVTSTQVVGLQQVFNGLIEEQTKNLMMTEVQEGYVFTVVDPATVPEIKFRPARSLICIAITLAGFCFAALLALTIDYFRSHRLH